MYFSKNSRYVLQKAQFLPPKFFKVTEKKLSFKVPDEDPSKPPLRLNIPKDKPQDDIFPVVGDTEPISLVSISQTSSIRDDDLLSKCEKEFQLTSLAKDEISPSDLNLPFTKSDISLEVTSRDAQELREISCRAPEVEHRKEPPPGLDAPLEPPTDPSETKSLFIIIDIPEKSEVKSLDREQDSTEVGLSHRDLEEGFPDKTPLELKDVRKSKDVFFRGAKSLPQIPLLKEKLKRTRRLEVTEVEDNGTLVFHVKLKKSSTKTSSAYRPVEKELAPKCGISNSNTSDAEMPFRTPAKPSVSVTETPQMVASGADEQQTPPNLSAKATNEKKTGGLGQVVFPKYKNCFVGKTSYKRVKLPRKFESDDYNAVKVACKTYPFRLPLKIAQKNEEVPQEYENEAENSLDITSEYQVAQVEAADAESSDPFQQQEAAETEAEVSQDDCPYINIDQIKSKNEYKRQKPRKKLLANSQYDNAERLDTDAVNFHTTSSYVSFGCENVSETTAHFGVAFPPLIDEALKDRFRLKKGVFAPERRGVLCGSWKSKSVDEKKVAELSANSILFPKKEKFDCDSLFTTREDVILNLIKNSENQKQVQAEQSSKLACDTSKDGGSIDGLKVMKKVREIVQFDLENAIKIFNSEEQKLEKEVSSVVVQNGSGWEVDKEGLLKETKQRENESLLMDRRDLQEGFGDLLGDETHITKYLPPRREAVVEMSLVKGDSVITFNSNTNEFFVNKEALAEAIARKVDEPYQEVMETLNMIAKDSRKSGDSILVFDEETQSWKVDFSILDRREQQLRLERELAERSELILETFEKLEKSQPTSVPLPVTRDKKTFDYTKEKWDAYNPGKGSDDKSAKSKSPFKESDAEEIRKKNSDLYENLFVPKKPEAFVQKPIINDPKKNESETEKKAKSYVLSSEKRDSSGGGSSPTATPGKSPSDSVSCEDKRKKEDKEDNFWESFLDMNILPKDISEIPKKPTPQPPIPSKTKPTPPSKSPFRIPLPSAGVPLPSEPAPAQAPPSKEPPAPNIPAPKDPPPLQEPTKDPLVPPKEPPPLQRSSKDPPVAPKIPLTGIPVPKGAPKEVPKPPPPKGTPLDSKIPSDKTPGVSLPKDAPLAPENIKAPPAQPAEKIEEPRFRLRIPFIKNKKTEKTPPPPGEKKPDVKDPKSPPSSKGDPKPGKSPPSIGSSKPTSKNVQDPPVTPKGKVEEPKTNKGKTEASAIDHYVSDKIIEITRVKNGDTPGKVKTSKIETMKPKINKESRQPSKVKEINLKGKMDEGQKSPIVGEPPGVTPGSKEQSTKEKKNLYKDFEKYKTPSSEPDYEEKSGKIRSDLENNPNLTKLDNWNKTLVLHDIMKPPENIENWLKDETDKMATLLLKVLQEASDGKPKKKQSATKTKTERPLKGNPYDSIRKKQENNPENFLFRLRTVNVALDTEKKPKGKESEKPDIQAQHLKEVPVQSEKSTKAPKVLVSVNFPKDGKMALESPKPALEYHVVEDTRTTHSLQEPSALMSRENLQVVKLPFDLTEEIPGPEILKKISSAWKMFPILGMQMTVFTLLRVFQLVNLGSSFLNHQNSDSVKRNAFSKLFHKYGPIVNIQGPLSGNVVLIHQPDHLGSVFDQDISLSTRSVFDSVEQVRRDAEDNTVPVGIYTDWTKPEWNELRRGTTDLMVTAGRKYLGAINVTADSFVANIKANRNSQNYVSDDFMDDIKRWSLEGLCNIFFEKSFGFLDGRIRGQGTGMSCMTEPHKMFLALEEATRYLNRCERGFQLWRLTPTPSTTGLGKAYKQLALILAKQFYQSEMSLKNKRELLKSKKPLPTRDLTFIESMLLNDGMTFDETICNLIDVFLIGTNTMNSAMGFLLYHLAQNVKVQMKLIEELKEHLPEKDSPLTYTSLSCLKYLQACLKETLRLHFPIPVFYRLLQNDILLYNYIIPKGTFMVMDFRTTGMRDQVFDEPEKFLPERWLQEERWLQHSHPFTALPFCHGQRADLAKRVVEMQLLTCAAKIVRNFQLNYHYGEIENSNGIISLPDKPLKLAFVEREL